MLNYTRPITADDHIYRLSIENGGDGKYEITLNDRTVILRKNYSGWEIEENGSRLPLDGTNGRTVWQNALAKALTMLDADRLTKLVEQKRSIAQQWAVKS